VFIAKKFQILQHDSMKDRPTLRSLATRDLVLPTVKKLAITREREKANPVGYTGSQDS
jgi:hypothetical protein